MKLSKERMLEIAERKEKCIKCDMENCVNCDNFVCANKAWGEEIAFYEKVRELMQADAEGRLVVLPCKVGDTVYHIGWNCRKGVSYNCEVDGIMTAANCRYCRDKKPCDLHRCVKEVTFEDELKIFESMLSGEFEKQLFITKEEAEAELKKMGGGEK